MTYFTYTEKMRDWMRLNYMLRLDRLTDAFNFQFDVNYTRESINSFRKRLGLKVGRSGQFIKGHAPVNKGTKGLMKSNSGSFSKGNRPHNYQPIGTEVLTKDGYIKIKIANPNKWQLKHRVTWEKHHGPIPKGYIVKFIDDNKENCNIENLMLISMKENAVINKCYPGATPEYKHTTTLLAQIKIATKDRIKRGKTNAKTLP